MPDREPHPEHGKVEHFTTSASGTGANGRNPGPNAAVSRAKTNSREKPTKSAKKGPTGIPEADSVVQIQD